MEKSFIYYVFKSCGQIPGKKYDQTMFGGIEYSRFAK